MDKFYINKHGAVCPKYAYWIRGNKEGIVSEMNDEEIKQVNIRLRILRKLKKKQCQNLNN